MGRLGDLLEEWGWLALPAGFVLICGLCCHDCFYGEPGPGWGSSACLIDADTLQYTTEITVADAPIPVDVAVEAGEFGSAIDRFVSAEPLEDGMWRATFMNTHTGETADQILPTCTD